MTPNKACSHRRCSGANEKIESELYAGQWSKWRDHLYERQSIESGTGVVDLCEGDFVFDSAGRGVGNAAGVLHSEVKADLRGCRCFSGAAAVSRDGLCV